MPQVDGTLYMRKSSSSVTAYFLVLAVLFDSADDAIHAMRGVCDGTNNVMPLRQPKNKYLKPDDESLAQSYVNANGCHKSVAKLLNLPRYLVTDMLDGLGLPNLTFKVVEEHKSAVEGLVSFYTKAQPFLTSVDASGIGLRRFESLLRKCGPRMTKALAKIQPQSVPRVRGRNGKISLPRNQDAIYESEIAHLAIG